MIFLALLVVSVLIARLPLRRTDNALRDSARIGFGVAFAIAGLTHFLTPTLFVQHMPEWVPGRESIVYASGALEMLGGIALAVSKRHARELAILIGLYLIAVFPSNIYVAVAGIDVEGQPGGIYPWVRLPFQALYIWWVLASAGVRRADLARISVKKLSLTLLAALALVGCSSTSASVNDASTTDVSADVVVVMEDASFQTESITLSEGDESTIEIVNKDSVPHDFAIESLDLNAGTIEPGESAVTTVVAIKTTHEFACTFHPGMKGHIEVV
jgi:uncharacterized membrane protein/plastocyanin